MAEKQLNIKSKTLANGFKLIWNKESANPLVSLQLFVRMGSNWESEQEAGFSHLTEHLVFKSTELYPVNAITDKAVSLGAQINAYTEYDSTCFFLSLPSEFLGEGLEILAELTRHANFSEEDFRFERGVVIEEIKQYENDAVETFIESLPGLYYKYNPYRNSISGREEVLKNSTHQQLEAFYRKWYTPDNAFLVVTGDLSEDKLMKYIDTYFATWAGEAPKKQNIQDEPFPVSGKFKSIKGKVSQDVLAWVVPELKDIHPQSYALMIGMKAFAGNKESRLYKRLFEEEKLIDSIRIHSFSGILNGLTAIVINPKKNSSLNRIAAVFMEEFHQLLDGGLRFSEFEKQKRDAPFSYRYSLEYMDSLGQCLGSEEIIEDYRQFELYPQRIGKITKSEVDEAMCSYFTPQSLHCYHLGKKQIELDTNAVVVNRSKISNTFSRDNYTEYRLDCGMKLCLKHITGRPTIGVSMAIDASQLHEPEWQRGINQMTAMMLLYGSEKRNYRQLLDFTAQHGIMLHVSPRTELTLMNMKCFTDTLFTGLDLLIETLFQPVFPQEHFDNIRKTIMSAQSRIKDKPGRYGLQQWNRMILGTDSNFHNRNGTQTQLRKLSRQQLIGWHKNMFGASGMTLSLVGDFQSEFVANYLNKLLNHPDSAGKRLSKSTRIFPRELRTKYKRTGTNQSVINLGGFGISSSNKKDYTTMYVLSELLGGDLNSRLFVELRERMGVAYSVGFITRATHDIGLFRAAAIADKAREKETITAMKRVLSASTEEGHFSIEELETVRNSIRGSRLLADESVLNQAETLTTLSLLGYSYQFYLDRNNRLQKVTLEDIQQLAKRLFKDENYYLHVLS
ncbi:MAG: insulinase family protein [Candidatus Cloacimonetes bacterium]|nr:insulinase family protein [Candidatus Cloacimonadota bacterium]